MFFKAKKVEQEDSHIVLGKGFAFKNPSKIIDIKLYDKHRTGHMWVFGTTRSGKTRLIEHMLETDLRKGHSVVLIDPKGDIEIFEKIVQIAAETNRLDDLMLINPIFPDYSMSLNPLHYYYMPEELVGHLVSGVEVGKEPFFYNVAYETSLIVVQSYLLLAKMETGNSRFNFNDVKDIISHHDLEELLRKIKSIDTDEGRQLAGDLEKIVNSGQDYYNKVSSSLRVALMELTQGNIGRLIGNARENRFIDRLQKGQGVILVVQLGSLITRKAAFTLGKVIVSMIQAFVGRVFSSGKKVTPSLCLYIDEAQNVLYKGIDDLFAKAGGANVWVHGFSQSVNQIYAELGQEYGNAILDNTNTKLFLRVPDKATAEYISEHFGEVKGFSPILNVGGTITFRDEEKETLKPIDLLELKPREFYMIGYDGRFKGVTASVEGSIVKLQYPQVEVIK